MLIHFSKQSANVKTGKIPVSTSCETTCPTSCPLKNKGCYAKTGPVSWHWNKVSNGLRGDDYNTFIRNVADIKHGGLWRHNVAGDLQHNNQRIDKRALKLLVRANQGKKGFTYTHHKTSLKANREAIKYANDKGFTINLSADNVEQADKLTALNIAPVVVIVDSEQKENLQTPQGHKVVICPATIRDDISCKTCQLCQKQDRPIIGFPAHGTSKKAVNQIIKFK